LIKVKLADGRVINVQSDDPEQAARLAHEWGKSNPRKPSEPQETTWQDRVGGLAGNYLDGILPGASGFARGVREAGLNAIQAPFSDEVDFEPIKSYNAGKRFQEQRNKRAQAADPTLNSGAQVTGMVAGLVLPATKIAGGASMGKRALEGAKTAGAYSAASGAMSSDADTLGGSVTDSVSSGLTGASVGAAFPLAGRWATAAARPFKPIADPLLRASGRGLQSVAARLPKAPPRVREALAIEGAQLARDPTRAVANRQLGQQLTDGINPATGQPFTLDEIVAEVAERHSAGVPGVPADIHEAARRSLGAAVRTPGPATSRVRTMIADRQAASGSRLSGQVREALGPTANIDAQAEAIRDAAKAQAGPLYDAAYAAPGASDSVIAGIVGNQSNAMKSALSHARELALRENRDPTTLGFDLDDAGEVILTKVPSFETLDLVKRGLEGVADKGRDAFGKLNNDGRTILSMSRPLVSRLREINEPYGQALDAFAGPTAGREALMAGRDSLKDGADDLVNVTQGMTPFERENFALGNRSAMANDMSDFGRKTPYGNAAAKLKQNFGLPGAETYKAQQGVHGADKVDELAQVADWEHDANRTFQAAWGGSGTPEGLADLAEQDRLIEDAGSGFLQLLAGHPGPGLRNVASAVLKGQRDGKEIKGHIASVLAEQDPQALQAAVEEIAREQARKAQVDQRATDVNQRIGRLFGGFLGSSIIDTVDDPASY
jgi:hypothetical protein